jgi:hypothetical protein
MWRIQVAFDLGNRAKKAVAMTLLRVRCSMREGRFDRIEVDSFLFLQFHRRIEALGFVA